MKVLITGAFGNLGLMCVNQAIELGYEVTCFDLDTAKNRKQADCLTNVTTILGDIRDSSTLEALVKGVDAIIHNASILPPVTDNQPDLARRINVDACKILIDIAERSPNNPVFIFPSSVTVFGKPETDHSLKQSSDFVNPTDNYTRHKVEIEEYLKASSLNWVVLRVGVSVDARTLATDKQTFINLLSVRPSNPLEYVHPKDVALAMCNAVSASDAIKKVLLVGGGSDCQITQYEFISTAFQALGLNLKVSVLGNNSFYTHWMNTGEANQILDFQQHSFFDYRNEMYSKMRYIRPLVVCLSFILNPIINLYLKKQVIKNMT